MSRPRLTATRSTGPKERPWTRPCSSGRVHRNAPDRPDLYGHGPPSSRSRWRAERRVGVRLSRLLRAFSRPGSPDYGTAAASQDRIFIHRRAEGAMSASAACRARSPRVFLPASYAMRAPRLWMFPSGARKVSQVQVPSDSGSPSSSAPPRASSASPDPGRPPRAAGRCCRRGCGRTRSSGGRGRIAGSCRRSRR